MRIRRMASEAMIISSRSVSVTRLDRAVDQPRAVVEGDDADACGQARLKFLDLVFDALG